MKYDRAGKKNPDKKDKLTEAALNKAADPSGNLKPFSEGDNKTSKKDKSQFEDGPPEKKPK